MDRNDHKEIIKLTVSKSIMSFFQNKEVKVSHPLDLIFPRERQIRSLIGGLETSLGTQVWEPLAKMFAKNNGFSSWYTPNHGEYMESRGEFKGEKAIAIIPLTFMNLSGRAIAHFVKTEEDLKKLIVVHDDLDIPIGEIKESINRGDGGHNGVNNIIKVLGSKDFKRIRIGISPVG